MRCGRLDILVSNAGLSLDKPLVETTEQELNEIFALNTKGPVFRHVGSGEVIEETSDREHLEWNPEKR